MRGVTLDDNLMRSLVKAVRKNPPKCGWGNPNKANAFEHRICCAKKRLIFPTASGIVQLRVRHQHS